MSNSSISVPRWMVEQKVANERFKQLSAMVKQKAAIKQLQDLSAAWSSR